jgi:hypothetical protein
MKILGIEIGAVSPEKPVSPIVEYRPTVETPDPQITHLTARLHDVYQWSLGLQKSLDEALALSSKLERHLSESQQEKYAFVRRLDAAIAERNGVSDRLIEASDRLVEALKQIAALKEQIPETKLPRMVSHKPAPTVQP